MTLAGLLTIILMALTTFLTRITGYLLFRNKPLNLKTKKIMQTTAGCVLISIITPVVVSGHTADALAVILTAIVMLKLPFFATICFAVAVTAVLRMWLGH